MLDILYSIIFYLIFSLFGIAGFFVLTLILKNSNKIILYSISKPLGLILFAYPIWLLSSVKILPFNQTNLLIALFILFISVFIGGIIWKIHRRMSINLKDIELQKLVVGIISVEIGTIILYAIYMYIRAFNPAIEGTEKFMDLMMLSSAGKTDFFPFGDAWWSGKDVNYYYYGFYIFALLANISQVPYSYAYNLSLGIIFSQTFIIIFTTIFNVSKNYLSAFFGSVLVNLAGNLHYANCVANNLNENIRTNCFYPKASRILDPAFTINEFPAYSYILGDLHPHVLSLPFFALGLFLLTEVFKEKKLNIMLHLVYGFVIATAGLINFWDFMTLGALYGLIVIYKISASLLKNRKKIAEYIKTRRYNLVLKTGLLILLAISPFLLYLPFFLHFKSPVTGIGFAPEFVSYHSQAYPDMQWPSSSWFQFGMWGFFVMLIIPSAIIFFFIQWEKAKEAAFATIIFFFAISLIIFTELFFFRDLFHIANPPYFRANTVFKFTYHSWILFGISTALFLNLGWNALGKIRNASIGIALDISALIVISVIFTLAFMYPHFGFSQAYYLDVANIQQKIQNNELTLDGSKFIKSRNIDDYETIKWINANQRERVVIAESVGGAYTYNARISTHTGMRNIINWETHQWTWRFAYPDKVKDWERVWKEKMNTGYNEISNTTFEARTLYITEDVKIARTIIDTYNVKYIYVGDQERITYPDLSEEKFHDICEIVFESGNSRLYKVN